MARIAGVDIPKDKQAWIALTYIYGVGRSTSRDILKRAQVGEEIRMKDLTEEEVTRIRNIIDNALKYSDPLEVVVVDVNKKYNDIEKEQIFTDGQGSKIKPFLCHIKS